MWIINRLVIIVIASSLVFYASWIDLSSSLFITVVMTGITAVISAVILFLDRILKNLNGEHLLYISTGAAFGLVTGYFLSLFVLSLGIHVPGLEQLVYVISVVFCGFVGAHFSGFSVKNVNADGNPEFETKGGKAKLLDTSVIIDGRILDIAETFFIDGPFIIPNFVLREIQLISDSSDPIKRNRGRRGLEMLNKLQESKNLDVKISYLDYTDTREVDQKLVKASLETGAQLVTNDFNLNQVATLQGVQVLNLNNLTTALKPVVLPGEDIVIEIIKEGKDDNQGIGYLEDGTMVVVENGGNMQGKRVRVNVTSIIQTAAGKMIFTRSEGVVEDAPSTSDAATSGGRNTNRKRRPNNNRNRQGGNRNRNDSNDSGDSDRGGNKSRHDNKDRE